MRFSPLSRLRAQDRGPLADLVDAHATALTRGTPGFEALLEQYDRVTATEAGDLLSLAELVSRTLVPVKPDERFVRALADDLRAASVPSFSIVDRIRHLPRTQRAAAGIGGAATLTVTAGVVWIAWRSEGGLMGLLRRWMPAA